MTKRSSVAAALGLVVLSACGQRADRKIEVPPSVPFEEYVRLHPSTPHPIRRVSEIRTGKFGIKCKVTHPTVVGPPSYSVYDIGKTGVPRVTPSQIGLIRRILKYVGSPTIRFAFLSRHEFIVFDTQGQPCAAFALGLPVLNEVNSYYQPGEDPRYTHSGPGGSLPPTPWPWMSPHP